MNDYTKYYTPLELAYKLIGQIHLPDNSEVIDICCGSGNLLKAALRQNSTCSCYGVDLIKHNIEGCKTYVFDGRDYAIHHSKTFDFAFANPPFETNKHDSFSDRLFINEYAGICSKRIEIEMLLANLRIIREGGKLVIILPITFVVGEMYRKIRRIIAVENTIEQIIYLPLNAFYPERINCCAIIIKKENNSLEMPTKVYTMDEEFYIQEYKSVPFQNMSEGEWSGVVRKKSKQFMLKRGNIFSSCFSTEGERVLHTSKSDYPWRPSVKYVERKSDILSKGVLATDGDIIISRVGKSAGEKCIYHGEPIYISDQLFVAKCFSADAVNNIMKIDFSVIKKGLSVMYITSGDIYSLYANKFDGY